MGLWKLSIVELKLFLRDPISLLFTFVYPVFVLFILAGVFGNEVETGDDERVWRGVGPTDYYVPAYIGLVMASIGLLALPLRLAGYRERGVLRRLRASSVPVGYIFGAQATVAAITAIVGAVTIAVLSLIAFGTMLAQDVLRFVPAFVMALACFTAIGLMLGSLLPNGRAAQALGLVLFFVMMMISGAGPPREVLDSTMRAVSDGLPLTHVVLLLQDPWLGLGWHWGATAVVAGFIVVPLAIAWRFFRWD